MPRDGNILLDKMKREETEERLSSLTGIELIMLQNMIVQYIEKSESIVTKSRWNEILYKVGGE
jgi:hypothetical protein